MTIDTAFTLKALETIKAALELYIESFEYEYHDEPEAKDADDAYALVSTWIELAKADQNTDSTK